MEMNWNGFVYLSWTLPLAVSASDRVISSFVVLFCFLVTFIAEDMATWESSGQWMFSCYSPEKGKPNVPGR